MTRRSGSDLVLGFHPTSRGFGWALFAGPNDLLDWGLAWATGDKNPTCLHHLRRILDQHRPDLFVLERFDRRTGKRATRVGRLCAAASRLADQAGADVIFMRRTEVNLGLGQPRDSTRQAVAELVADHLEGLRHRLPRARRAWDSSDRRMALFSAAALSLAVYVHA